MDDVQQPGLLTGGQVTRREVLKKGLIGAAGLTVLPAVITACNSAAATPTLAPVTAAPVTAAPVSAAPAVTPTAGAPTTFLGKLTGALTVGSNHSDASEVAGMGAITTAFAALTGLAPKVNKVDHNTFQTQINNYLGGTPDDAFTWFSGFRMRFFASKGLATAIDDVWANVKANYTPGFSNAVVGDDKHVYGIPVDYYPWCVFYRKSFFASKGYTIPATWADFLTLCAKMQKDGITPLAFGDDGGWPAMGWFDILNLRMNGYDFHVGLMTGANKWTDPKVTAVFTEWAKIVPYYLHGFAGLTWEKACDSLIQQKSGMFLLGLFMTGEVATTDAANKTSVLADIDFFPFPFMGNSFDAEKALDAPIDIWMLSAKSPSLQADLTNAKAWMEFWSKGSTQVLMYQQQPGFIPTASDADTSGYDVLTKKAVSIVSQALKITQFLDRDTRPDFAGTNGVGSFFLNFLNKPTQDLTAFQKSIQDFWDKLPAYSG
jgi:multiple sugar transport system substrate-binding protein